MPPETTAAVPQGTAEVGAQAMAGARPASSFSSNIVPLIVLILFTAAAWWLCKKFKFSQFFSGVVFSFGLFNPKIALILIIALLCAGLIKTLIIRNRQTDNKN